MSALLPIHEVSTIGETTKISYTGVSAATQLAANPQGTGPHRYLLRSDGDVNLRQGDSSVAATTSDLKLKTDTYMVITVESQADSYLAAITATGASNSDLYVTEISNRLNPGG